ncbi:MAG: tetratricopeptide repeat protein, partial [Thermodesulfobacteriota bacterium]
MRRSSALVAVLLAAGAALAQPPKETELRKESGNHYLKLRQYEAARDQYLAALQLDETYTDAHYNLGVVYFFRLQDYPRALYHFVRYAQLKPDASDLDQVRGLSLQALDRIEAAERTAYAQALEQATPQALEGFLAAHPLSSYAPDAREKLRILREREEGALRLRRDTEAAYEAAVAKATPEAMDHFLASYPQAPQAEEGRRLRDLWASRRAEDRQALDRALAAQSAEALEEFLRDRPRSPLAS